MKRVLLLSLLGLGACASPPVEQAAQTCAFYDTIGPCFDGRDITRRINREDLANRTPGVRMSLADITSRTNREDLANRTPGVRMSLADVTKRANREDLANRTPPVRMSLADITNRTNREDPTNRPLVCP